MRPRFALSFGNYFLCAHYAFMLYITTPYLATVVPDRFVGLVLSLGAAITILSFPFVPRIVRACGAKRVILWSLTISALLLLLLAFYPSPLIAVSLYALFFALGPIISYLLDLLLEASTTEEGSTGQIRALFITFGNLAYATGSLSFVFFLGNDANYANVFYVAALCLVPLLFILSFITIPDGKPPVFAHILEVARCLFKDKDLRAVGIAYGTLQFFFSLVPYFTPLYLHNVLGIPWSELGWVFALTIVPFLLIEYPAGWVADRILGDKELMAIGFLIMGAATAALALTSAATSIAVIGGVLFATRIGAALCEAMCETHFFRRVSDRDANTVGVFRMIRPVGSLIAPFVASVLIAISTYNVLFFVVGLMIIVVGVGSALSIKDVR